MADEAEKSGAYEAFKAGGPKAPMFCSDPLNARFRGLEGHQVRWPSVGQGARKHQ